MNPTQTVMKLYDLVTSDTNMDEIHNILLECIQEGWFAIYGSNADIDPYIEDVEFYEDQVKAASVALAATVLESESIYVTAYNGKVYETDGVTIYGD